MEAATPTSSPTNEETITINQRTAESTEEAADADAVVDGGVVVGVTMVAAIAVVVVVAMTMEIEAMEVAATTVVTVATTAAVACRFNLTFRNGPQRRVPVVHSVNCIKKTFSNSRIANCPLPSNLG